MSNTIIVKRTGQAPLRVRGEVVASNGTAEGQGSPGRWQDVKVLSTASKRYVVSIHHNTMWQGEHDTDEAVVLPSLNQVVEYLGERVPGWLLTELIEELGEEAVAEEVE
ncbi:MAG: hypothetical protein U1D67_01335 [Dehalococcoidia bacterium]|nr:hypothetical protein [Dehalococcoidia bacterium]